MPTLSAFLSLLLFCSSAAIAQEKGPAPQRKDSVTVSGAVSKEQLTLEDRLNTILSDADQALKAGHAGDAVKQYEAALEMVRKEPLLAEQEQRGVELTDRLRKQLWSVRKLSRLLDDAEKAAARLRSSRRWKLANPKTAIEAKLFPGKVSMGYGHLEKIVAAYSEWRASHPEIAKIEEQISALQFPTVPKWPCVDSGKNTQSSEAVGPPVPSLPVESMHFPTYEDVEVSIIIPVFNQFQYTHACLGSLQAAEERSTFEVIVVEIPDASAKTDCLFKGQSAIRVGAQAIAT